MPNHFTVQYHAESQVASHEHKAWVVNMDGVDISYRMQACQPADGQADPHCAVFVPSEMGRRDASRMLAAFSAAHPGVIPPHLVFQFDRDNWWLRTRRSLSSHLDQHERQPDV